MRVDYEYERRCRLPSDIQNHLPRLRWYANQCESVVEMGVYQANSTWALLAGRPRKMVSHDLWPYIDVAETTKAAEEAGVQWSFVQGSVLNGRIEHCDLLFIDTWHHYHQLRAEFELHAPSAQKYIILHDTETNRHQGSGGHPGMQKAIDELLTAGEWQLVRHYPDSNGLTILGRIKKAKPRPVTWSIIEYAQKLSEAKFLEPVPCRAM
jgi:hypothetical protein